MGDSNGTSAAYLQPQHQQTAYQYTQQQLQPQQTCAYTQVQHAPQTAAYAYTQPQQQQQQQHAVSNLNSLLYSNQQQVQLAAPHTPQGQNACYSYVNHAPNHQQQQLAAAFTTTSVPYHTPNGFYYGSYHYMQHQLQQQQHYQQQQQQMQYVYNFQQQPVAANSARPAYTYSTINPYATSTTAQQPGQQVVGYQTAHTAAWAEYTNTTLPILTAQQQAVPASYASSKPAAAAASAATVKPEPVPAAAAAAAARSPKVADEPTAEHWYIPSRFLQLPDTTSAHTVKFDLRKMTHAQLLKAAARYNSDHDVGDPIADTLDGVVEKARLRPGSSPAHAFTMGGVPNDSIYAKAWRGIKRGGKPPSTDTARLLDKKLPDSPAGKPMRSAGATSAAGGGMTPSSRHHGGKLLLPPEQQRWRAKLSAFLGGRKVSIPRLAPGAPLLDIKELWQQVMNQGGSQAVTATAGWSYLAAMLQRDDGLSEAVAAVYACYLQPLEAQLPEGYRPARAVDFMEGRTQHRAAAGRLVACYDAVVKAAARAGNTMREWQHAKQRWQQQQEQQTKQPVELQQARLEGSAVQAGLTGAEPADAEPPTPADTSSELPAAAPAAQAASAPVEAEATLPTSKVAGAAIPTDLPTAAVSVVPTQAGHEQMESDGPAPDVRPTQACEVQAPGVSGSTQLASGLHIQHTPAAAVRPPGQGTIMATDEAAAGVLGNANNIQDSARVAGGIGITEPTDNTHIMTPQQEQPQQQEQEQQQTTAAAADHSGDQGAEPASTQPQTAQDNSGIDSVQAPRLVDGTSAQLPSVVLQLLRAAAVEPYLTVDVFCRLIPRDVELAAQIKAMKLKARAKRKQKQQQQQQTPQQDESAAGAQVDKNDGLDESLSTSGPDDSDDNEGVPAGAAELMHSEAAGTGQELTTPKKRGRGRPPKRRKTKLTPSTVDTNAQDGVAAAGNHSGPDKQTVEGAVMQHNAIAPAAAIAAPQEGIQSAADSAMLPTAIANGMDEAHVGCVKDDGSPQHKPSLQIEVVELDMAPEQQQQQKQQHEEKQQQQRHEQQEEQCDVLQQEAAEVSIDGADDNAADIAIGGGAAGMQHTQLLHDSMQAQAMEVQIATQQAAGAITPLKHMEEQLRSLQQIAGCGSAATGRVTAAKPTSSSVAALTASKLQSISIQAARCLVLSLRTLRSGPPGCEKPPLRLPAPSTTSTNHMTAPGAAAAAAAAAAIVNHVTKAAQASSMPGGAPPGLPKRPLFGETAAVKGPKRTFVGITPKCGACHTCMNPQLKKACATNRERLAKGLAPVYLQPAPKLSES
eukprot:jgi/Chrzof1/16/Cz01g00170.t1